MLVAFQGHDNRSMSQSEAVFLAREFWLFLSCDPFIHSLVGWFAERIYFRNATPTHPIFLRLAFRQSWPLSLDVGFYYFSDIYYH